MLVFVQAVPSVVESLGCFERIETYIGKQPVRKRHSKSPPSDEHTSPQRDIIELTSPTVNRQIDSPIASFIGADISWSDNGEIVLKDLTLNIKKGITMVIGPVSSGKSTLIKSILGETFVKHGKAAAQPLGIAYCPQTPWIINETIQFNITGETEIDAQWYDFCVAACGLSDDLRALSKGSMHKAGSDGTSLSGGQKQRVVRWNPL